MDYGDTLTLFHDERLIHIDGDTIYLVQNPGILQINSDNMINLVKM